MVVVCKCVGALQPEQEKDGASTETSCKKAFSQPLTSLIQYPFPCKPNDSQARRPRAGGASEDYSGTIGPSREGRESARIDERITRTGWAPRVSLLVELPLEGLALPDCK